MRRYSMGGSTLALAFALAIPTLVTSSAASAEPATAAAKSDETAPGTENAPSKEDQAKLKQHNKLRAEIARQKYPAAKSEVLAHVRGIKADDKEWFAETLPDRVYTSAEDVMTALGWEASPPSGKDKKTSQ
jgi:hypothetical protein